MDRLLSVFLVEMDGLVSKASDSVVFVLATTADKAQLDPAILRPGRLDQHVHLTLPDYTARVAICTHSLSKLALADTDDFMSSNPFFTSSFAATQAPLPVRDVFAQRLATMTAGVVC